MNNQVYFTVFTSTYNRGDLLVNLYHSLINQSFKDFEWIIIDDGSIDNTEDIANGFITDSFFQINYVKVPNGGKHRAINKGLQMANGKAFAIVDSDDTLTSNALQKLYEWFNEIEKSDKKFCGVAGNKGFSIDHMVGTSFDGEFIDATNIDRKKYNISGDKFEVYYTEILKNYEFPTFEGEKFMAETVVWTRMAKDGYLIRWYNEIIYVCNYLENGLTDLNLKLLANNPKGYALRIREQVMYGSLSIKEKLGYFSNYFLLCKKNRSLREASQELNCTVFEILIAAILRRIVIFMRGESNEYK